MSHPEEHHSTSSPFLRSHFHAINSTPHLPSSQKCSHHPGRLQADTWIRAWQKHLSHALPMAGLSLPSLPGHLKHPNPSKDQAELTDPAWLVTQGQRQVWMCWGWREQTFPLSSVAFLGQVLWCKQGNFTPKTLLTRGQKVILQIPSNLVFQKNSQLGTLELIHALSKVHQYIYMYIWLVVWLVFFNVAALLYGKKPKSSL